MAPLDAHLGQDGRTLAYSRGRNTCPLPLALLLRPSRSVGELEGSAEEARRTPRKTGYDGLGPARVGGSALVQGAFVKRQFLSVTGFFGTLIFSIGLVVVSSAAATVRPHKGRYFPPPLTRR